RSTAARTTAAGSGSGAGTGAGEGGGGGGGVGSDSVAGVAPGAGVASGAGSGDVTGTDAGPGGGPAATAVAGSGAGGAASRYAVSPASVSCSYSSLVGTVMPCRSCSQRTSSTRMIESRPSAVSESWSPISSGGRPSAAATRSRTVSAPGAVRGAPEASGPGAGTGTDRLRCGCSSGPRGVSRTLPSADRRGPAVTEPAAVPAGASSAARGNQWAVRVKPGTGRDTRPGGTGQNASQSTA